MLRNAGWIGILHCCDAHGMEPVHVTHAQQGAFVGRHGHVREHKEHGDGMSFMNRMYVCTSCELACSMVASSGPCG